MARIGRAGAVTIMSILLCGGALVRSTGVYHSPSARLSLMLLAEPPVDALAILREPDYRVVCQGGEMAAERREEEGSRAPNMSTG